MPTCYVRTTRAADGARYSVLYRVGGRYAGIKSAGTFRLKRDADARKEKVWTWLAQGKDPASELRALEAETMTVTQACDLYLTSRRGLAENSVRNYRAMLGWVTDRIGTVRVAHVTPQDVAGVVAELAPRYAATSVKQTVTMLAAVFDAIELVPNPARSKLVEAPRVEHVTLEPPTAVEVAAMLEVCKPEYRTTFVLIERTGLRISEALGVTAADVDRASCRLLVRTEVAKGGRGRQRARWVPVPDWLEPCAYGSRGGAAHAMQRACRKAGLREFGPHDLRHRRASLWHLGGVPVAQAAAWLGHTPAVHLRTYAHVMPLDEVSDERMVSFSSAARASVSVTK